MGKRLTRQRLKQIKHQLKVIDAEIRQRLEAEETLERRAGILTSIPGISDITAAGLIVHMPELGTLTGARAASLAGLAPVTRESGYWRGRGFIQGGRHRVRRLLHMPAMVAVRHNPDLKRKYEALVAKGKPHRMAMPSKILGAVTPSWAMVPQCGKWVRQAGHDPAELDSMIRSGPNAYDGRSDLVRKLCARPRGPDVRRNTTVIELIALLQLELAACAIESDTTG